MSARTRALFFHCPAMVVANEPISTTKKMGSISLLVTYNIITFSRKGAVRTFLTKPVIVPFSLWLYNLDKLSRTAEREVRWRRRLNSQKESLNIAKYKEELSSKQNSVRN